MNMERPTAKDFGWEVHPDRKLGLVDFTHKGILFRWHLTEDGVAILRNESYDLLSTEEREAMEDQVKAILKPELEKRLEARKSQTPSSEK